MSAGAVPRPGLVPDTLLPVLRTGPVPEDMEVVPGAGRPFSRLLLLAELSWVVAAMSVAALFLHPGVWLGLLVGCGVLLALYLPGRDAVRPGLPTPGRVVRELALPLAATAVAASTGWIAQAALDAALGMVLAAGSVTLLAAAARRAWTTGVRTVVIGPAAEVAETFARWDRDRRVSLVGSLVVEGEQPGDRPGDAFHAEDPRALILGFRPDMVMVVPGPGVDAMCIRRIGWALEGTGAGLAVCSGLEGIAAHRIQHTRMAGMSVMQVRTSRPSWLARGAKAAGDRVLALLLLAALSPLLLVLLGLVRATSPGPGLFAQVRVGRHGAPFTMYKLRTMRADAEEVKDRLRAVDEGNGLLFKKRDDPRVTPLGRLLRKYSLDELPQLINVLRGEMSLVGPRPALPEEVARYTPLERRRLAVRPGMTGAWQVSGRSTLGREESMRLDLDYTDNYRVVDDLLIAVRTVDAVARPQGAW
ncbi:sugar transferase [Nocardioides solisilvae]|uniref:sugar transferase n=1 Tax=Nocardioides solisilvae TaxID=1542435 RepID=UPI001EF4FF3D|nr:sugar transferase [Nocardioides solisilvae]